VSSDAQHKNSLSLRQIGMTAQTAKPPAGTPNGFAFVPIRAVFLDDNRMVVGPEASSYPSVQKEGRA